VIVVPGCSPKPTSVSPTTRAPELTAVTVSVAVVQGVGAQVVINPLKDASLAKTADTGTAVWIVVIVAVQGSTADVVSVSLATAFAIFRLYVPTPPVPVPSEVMDVPAATPVPRIIWPSSRVPWLTAVTVRTVPAMDPVKDVAGQANVVDRVVAEVGVPLETVKQFISAGTVAAVIVTLLPAPSVAEIVHMAAAVVMACQLALPRR
jgi:hypothetical protein